MKNSMFILLVFVACHKRESSMVPVNLPNPQVVYKGSAAYSAGGPGTPLTATAINFSVKVFEKGQVDSLKLVDELNPHSIATLFTPVSADYTILDEAPPYPSGHIYHLETFVHAGNKIVSSSFRAI